MSNTPNSSETIKMFLGKEDEEEEDSLIGQRGLCSSRPSPAHITNRFKPWHLWSLNCQGQEARNTWCASVRKQRKLELTSEDGGSQKSKGHQPSSLEEWQRSTKTSRRQFDVWLKGTKGRVLQRSPSWFQHVSDKVGFFLNSNWPFRFKVLLPASDPSVLSFTQTQI